MSEGSRVSWNLDRFREVVSTYSCIESRWRLSMDPLPTKRRAFLSAIAGVPGLPLLAAGGQASAAEDRPVGRDVIQELGIRSFINAAGTFTALSGSLMRPDVVHAMQVAARK